MKFKKKIRKVGTSYGILLPMWLIISKELGLGDWVEIDGEDIKIISEKEKENEN